MKCSLWSGGINSNRESASATIYDVFFDIIYKFWTVLFQYKSPLHDTFSVEVLICEISVYNNLLLEQNVAELVKRLDDR